ncbi:hypothetical protein L7F22_014921 [Adiantum nelumboides]|nr:hypothetical protein [Adiantum nelumboides]
MTVHFQVDNKSFNPQAKEVSFEGFEKWLQVEFSFKPINGANKNLRSLSQADLQLILVVVHGTIVLKLSNSEVESYVLSESSLFVYQISFLYQNLWHKKGSECSPCFTISCH